MKEELNISHGKVGMNKSSNVSSLKETEYILMVNGDIENEGGDIAYLTNEPSNILISRIKAGYKVIGYKESLSENKTFLCITNPLDKISEIGYIEGLNYFNKEEDIQSLCGCDVITALTSTLESTIQEQVLEYTTILEDSCNKCLNFDINYPIKNIEVKTEKRGSTLYFADGHNPDRYIQLWDLDRYREIGADTCGDNSLEPTCLDCEKLLIEPNTTPPTVTVLNRTDGALTKGVYFATIAYCDEVGTPISNYYSITNPIILHKVINPSETNLSTDMGFTLKVENLSYLHFKYYKIGIIYRNSESEVSFLTTSPITTSTTQYTVYTTKQLRRAANEELNTMKIAYKHSETLAQVGGYLFRGGLTSYKEINLQPIANLLGGMLKWATTKTTEDIYKSENIARYGDYIGYPRSETFPFGFYVTFKGGRTSSIFPFIGRPASTADKLPVVDELGVIIDDRNTDIESIRGNLNTCEVPDRTLYHQYYDTATVIGEFDNTAPPSATTIEIPEEFECVLANVVTIGAQTITIADDIPFNNLLEYIEDNKAGIIDPLSSFYNAEIATALTGAYPDDHCVITSSANCELDLGVAQPIESSIEVGAIVNEVVVGVEIPLDDYEVLPASQLAIVYRDEAGDKVNESWALENVHKLITPDNEGCKYAKTVYSDSAFDIHGQRYKDAAEANLLETQSVTCTSANFKNKLHKGSVWFKVDRRGRNKVVLQLANKRSIGDDYSKKGNNKYRISIFETCSSTATTSLINNSGTLVGCMILDSEDSYTFELDLQNYPASRFYIAFDFPMILFGEYYIVPLGNAVNLMIRDIQYDGFTVSYDSISFNKRETYKYLCSYDPSIDMCEPTPHEYGKFAYIESSEVYPDNEELYNSRKLLIRESDITVAEDLTLFQEFYKEAILEDGTVLLKEDTDFRCKPIKHFKFPSNLTSPFQHNSDLVFSATPTIYPLGIYIDKQTVKDFLLIAKNNGLLTEEQYNDIDSYTIVRGDRTNDKSVVAKGLLYDMYEYEESSKKVLFPNFPYNTLGDNHLFDNGIPHIGGSTSNHKFTFHSPETSFFKPSLPNEMLIDGYQYGKSSGRFINVEDHPTWVILSKKAYSVANALGFAEAALEFIISSTNARIQAAQTQWGVGGATWGGDPVGAVVSSISLIAQTISFAVNGVLKKGKYSLEWQKVIRDLGQPKNFAYYYISLGHYNKFVKNDKVYNQLRAINDAAYLKEQKHLLSTKTEGVLNINNLDRETSAFISFNEIFALNYDSTYVGYDNWNTNKNNASRTSLSDTYTCDGIGKTKEREKNIASPYVTLYNYRVNQYGGIYDIKWLSTGKPHILSNISDEELDFGGDTYISRFALKRKMPIFLYHAVGLAPLIPFNYSDSSNIPNATFYCDYELNEDNISLGKLLFPKISSDYNFDCDTSKGLYKSNKSKFYLSYYGIPSFLVETSINTFLRDRGINYEEDFYPNVVDYERWTQEKHVPLRENNRYIINDAYLNTEVPLATKLRPLPVSFKQVLYDTLQDMPNGLIYSEKDSSETDLFDPYLNYKVLNRTDLPRSYGKLVGISELGKGQILVRLTNKSVVFNATDTLADKLTKEQSNSDIGGVFALSPVELGSSNLGYSGSSNYSIAQNKFGSYWVDAQRGSVFFFPAGSSKPNLYEISATKLDGSPSNMKHWFKQHLPFKALQNNNVIGLDIDNPYNGIGIILGWDEKRERLFITKHDCIIEDDRKLFYKEGKFYAFVDKAATINIQQMSGAEYLGEEEDGFKLKFKRTTTLQTDPESEITYDRETIYYIEPELTAPKNKIDTSWTIAYKVASDSWVSYFDFKPNYYLSFNEYFLTGYNTLQNPLENGLWGHLLTNRSFGVFNGKKYDWTIEFPIINKFSNKVLEAISYEVENRRYSNSFNYAPIFTNGFNKLLVYNYMANSGYLELIPQGKNFSNYGGSSFPKTISSTVQQVLETQENTTKFNVNYFFDRIKNPYSGTPHMLGDLNDIMKEVNPAAVSFYNRDGINNRLTGNEFVVRLSSNDSQIRKIFKHAISKTV